MPYHHFVTLDTADGPMPTYIAAPGGAERHPGVLVIAGMHGAESFELEVAERLADEGYVAAAPDLFHRGPRCFSVEELDRRRRELTDPQKIADVNAALAYLQGLPDVHRDHIGIVGFCMGGRTAYLMATMSPEIRAAADFYGGGVPNAEGLASPFEMTSNIRCPIVTTQPLRLGAKGDPAKTCWIAGSTRWLCFLAVER